MSFIILYRIIVFSFSVLSIVRVLLEVWLPVQKLLAVSDATCYCYAIYG